VDSRFGASADDEGPVRGSALVVAANISDRYQNPQMLRVKLVVEAEGLPKTTVKHSQLIWGEWHFVRKATETKREKDLEAEAYGKHDKHHGAQFDPELQAMVDEEKKGQSS
jgi:hypothetical protein